MELAEPIRDQARKRLAALLPRTRTADQLRLEYFREERNRLANALLAGLYCVRLEHLFVREYPFHPQRQWRLDLYAPRHRLGVELHGGLNEKARGRHLRVSGFIGDREKMNAAAELGITVLEYWPKAIADGTAVAQIDRFITSRGVR